MLNFHVDINHKTILIFSSGGQDGHHLEMRFELFDADFGELQC